LACEGEQCILEVSDDGVGLPPGFDVEKTPSLGLKLVSVLTRQLQGAMHLESETGTRVAIEFRLAKRTRVM
jgi:two-component sensor histidine kinase